MVILENIKGAMRPGRGGVLHQINNNSLWDHSHVYSYRSISDVDKRDWLKSISTLQRAVEASREVQHEGTAEEGGILFDDAEKDLLRRSELLLSLRTVCHSWVESSDGEGTNASVKSASEASIVDLLHSWFYGGGIDTPEQGDGSMEMMAIQSSYQYSLLRKNVEENLYDIRLVLSIPSTSCKLTTP